MDSIKNKVNDIKQTAEQYGNIAKYRAIDTKNAFKKAPKVAKSAIVQAKNEALTDAEFAAFSVKQKFQDVGKAVSTKTEKVSKKTKKELKIVKNKNAQKLNSLKTALNSTKQKLSMEAFPDMELQITQIPEEGILAFDYVPANLNNFGYAENQGVSKIGAKIAYSGNVTLKETGNHIKQATTKIKDKIQPQITEEIQDVNLKEIVKLLANDNNLHLWMIHDKKSKAGSYAIMRSTAERTPCGFVEPEVKGVLDKKVSQTLNQFTKANNINALGSTIAKLKPEFDAYYEAKKSLNNQNTQKTPESAKSVGIRVQ